MSNPTYIDSTATTVIKTDKALYTILGIVGVIALSWYMRPSNTSAIEYKCDPILTGSYQQLSLAESDCRNYLDYLIKQGNDQYEDKNDEALSGTKAIIDQVEDKLGLVNKAKIGNKPRSFWLER